MKNLIKKRTNYFLIFLSLILFNCSSGKEKFIIEEIEILPNGTQTTKSKFEVTSFGSNFSYSSSSKSGSNDNLEDVTINFRNKQLNAILDKLEYPYILNKLTKNPLLKIYYYRENTTKEKALKEIITQLKKTYDF